jgi:hypothetical protein
MGFNNFFEKIIGGKKDKPDFEAEAEIDLPSSKKNKKEPEIDPLDKKITRDIEQRNFERKPFEKNASPDTRLSESEALLYQYYATSKEGLKPSKEGYISSVEATIQSYEEADQLIEKLRDKKFDFLQIDWKNLDLKDIDQFNELEKRLDEAVRMIANLQEKSELKSLTDKFKGVILPLILSASILLSQGIPAEARSQENKAKETVKQEEVLSDFSLKILGAETPRYKKLLSDWIGEKEKRGVLIENIHMDVSHKNVREIDRQGDNFSLAEVKVKLIVRLNNGKIFFAESMARSNDSPDSISNKAANYGEQLIKKITSQDVNLTDATDIAPVNVFRAEFQALQSALDDLDHQLVK